LTGKIQIWVDTKNPKSNLNLTGRIYLKFFKKKIQGPQAPEATGAVPQGKCGYVRFVCEDKVRSLEN